MHLRKVLLAIFVLAMAAYCQPSTLDTLYQVHYAANLTSGIDTVIDIINTGGDGFVPVNGPGFPNVSSGNICVNVYAIDPNEELLSCCSCLVTPNQTVELKVQAGIMNNVLTGFPTSSATIKLIGTTNGAINPTSCANVASQLGGGAGAVPADFIAFATTAHATTGGGFTVTESPFISATLSPSEVSSLNNRCASIIGNGSGAGICGGCTKGALGAAKQ
jgi:hypothetical protein